MEQRDTPHDIRLGTQEAMAGFCICMMLALISFRGAVVLMSTPGWKTGVSGFYLLIFGLILVALALACASDLWKRLRPGHQPGPTGSARPSR